MTPTTEQGASSLEDIVITGELEARPKRAPDHEGENRALGALAEALAGAPETVLQRLAEEAMALTGSQSAGVSLLEPGGDSGIFNWVATAGAWTPYRLGRMPREESPCGEVMAREALLMVKRPERAFPALLQAQPGISEALLAPFFVSGAAAGTVWVIKHDAQGRFDAEDARLLHSLTRFAGAGHQALEAVNEANVARRGTEQQLQLALDAAMLGTFIWYPEEDRGEPDARMAELFGLPDGALLNLSDALETMIHPDDRQRYADAAERAIDPSGDGMLSEQIRVCLADGSTRWLAIRGQTRFEGTPPRVARMAGTAADVTHGKQADERQAFLLRLSDALRGEPSAEAMTDRALRMLFEHMRLDRCYVGVYRLAEDLADFPQQVHDERLSPLPARVRLSDFPEALRVAFGRTLVVDDALAMESFSESDRASFSGLGLRAAIAATLRKGENNPLWAIVAGSSSARAWTQGEIALVEEVAERTWAAVERAHAEAALTQSEARYRNLFEAIDSGFCIIEMIFDEDGRAIDYRFVEANPAFERQSGLTDAIGSCISELTPDLEEHWLERYGRVALTGESVRVEGEVAPLGRWFDINAFRVGAPEQRRVAVLFSDISDRKRADVALRTSQKQFETLLNQAPLGVYLVDSDFTIRQVNPIALPVFGDIPGGPVGRDFDEVIHILWEKEYADEVVAIFRHTLETGEPYVTPERAQHRADLDIVEFYEWRADRIVFQDGRHGVVCYFRDISAQVQARKEIEKARDLARESEARLAAAFESVPVGVAVIDRSGGATLLNQEYSRFLPTGVIPSRDPAGQSRWRAWNAEGTPLNAHDFPGARALRGETVVPGQEMLFTDDDGREIWTSVSTAPIRTPGNGVTGAVAVISDIDAEKRFADALRESEERFRGFADNSADVLWIVNAGTMKLEYLSPAFERVWGETREAVIEDLARWAELVHPDDRDRAAQGMPRLVAGETYTGTYRIVRPDGQVRWIRDTGFPIDEGGAMRVGGIAQDITDLKAAEAAIGESEMRYRLIVENARDYAIIITDPDDIIIEWLPGAEAVFGWTREEAIGRPAGITFTPEDQAERVPQREIETAARDGEAPDVRWHQRKDGSQVFIEGTTTPLRNQDGSIRSYLKIGQDVSERRHAQEALEASERRMRLLATGIPQLVFRSLGDGFRIWGSPQWIDYTAISFEESVGFGWLDGIHPDDRDATMAAWQAVGDGRDYYCEHRILHAASGAYRWHQTRATPLRDGEGTVLEWLGTSSDVEELRVLQRRQGLLLAELQHRVRNILAMIRSVASRTAETAETVQDYCQHLDGRISTMARTQGLLTREVGTGIDLQNLILDELSAQAAQARQFAVTGPDVAIGAKAAEVLALAIHELATNSVKYGALSARDGRIDVRWAVLDGEPVPRLSFIWSEFGVTLDGGPSRKGFGTELITERVPYELQGIGNMEFRTGGLVATIEFPLLEAPSILQTDDGQKRSPA